MRPIESGQTKLRLSPNLKKATKKSLTDEVNSNTDEVGPLKGQTQLIFSNMYSQISHWSLSAAISRGVLRKYSISSSDSGFFIVCNCRILVDIVPNVMARRLLRRIFFQITGVSLPIFSFEYSRVHISSDEVFSKILKKISMRTSNPFI